MPQNITHILTGGGSAGGGEATTPTVTLRFSGMELPNVHLGRTVEAKQRTARCFGCGYRMPITPLKIRILLRTGIKDRAIEAVKRYKVKAGRLRESKDDL